VAQDLANLKPELAKAVIKLVTSERGYGSPSTGTGFLVTLDSRDPQKNTTFIATNKHMIGDWNCGNGDIRDVYDWVDAYLYRKTATGAPSWAATKIRLKNSEGNLNKSKVILHPDPSIDVALIALDTELSPSANVDVAIFDATFLLPFDKLPGSVGWGGQVFALGYPLGITSLRNSYPIAKAGYIASVPGDEVIVQSICVTRSQQQVPIVVRGKLILVDGLIVPGNSGGPVVIEGGVRVRRRQTTGPLEFSQSMDNFVVGIVSSSLGPSGLTTVISSDYIRDMMTTYVPNPSK
jgi:hypothetical protein